MKNALILSLLLFTAPATTFAAESILTGKTLVDADVVTVGDLFTNTGEKATHVLAPAPALGKKLILTAGDLQRVATAFKLEWEQPKENAVAILERDASAIDADDIITALRASDLKDEISKDAQFKINNLNENIVIKGQEKPELKIASTRFDPATEKFSAVLNIERDGTLLKEVVLEGLATEMAQVPVLKYPLMSSSEISAGYITEIAMPKNQIRDDMIMTKAELIGMTTRRGLKANQFISRADVNPPVLVKRNELVTIIYTNGPIRLSAKARSLGNGTAGESIMFINTTSKKTFEAKVTGPQQAEVNLNS